MASRAQTAINDLAKRWDRARSLTCKLGQEPPSRRGGKCSVCPKQLSASADSGGRLFELDDEIGKLVDNGTFRSKGVCPYGVMASHLVAGVVFSPEAFRAQGDGQSWIDPVTEIKGALRRLNSVTGSTSLSRDDIEALCEREPIWEALLEVHSAQALLKTALAKFQARPRTPAVRAAKGRTGALHIQAVAGATARAWRELTGRLPAKENSTFHRLLQAAVASIFGQPEGEPNLESATRKAVERIRKMKPKDRTLGN